MLFCRMLIVFKINFSKNSFRNTIQVSNRLDPDQAQHFVLPDLGPICLQRLRADDTSRQELTPYMHVSSADNIAVQTVWTQISF